MVKIEDGARIQKLVHESMNRLKNCSESDESDARVHESYSQIFDSFDSRFIRKIRKIRVQITPLAARQLGLPSAEQLNQYAVGILESGSTYDLAYRSAFIYDTRARMPLLRRPALVCAGPNDMLVSGLKGTKEINVPGIEVRETPTTVWWPDPEPKAAAETMAIYEEFLSRAM